MDEIWAEMQKELGPRHAPAKTVDLQVLQRQRLKPKKGASKGVDPAVRWIQQWSAGILPNEGMGVTSEQDVEGQLKQMEPPTTLIDAIDELPTDSPATFLAYLQRDINCLGEESLCVRLQSLQKLERVLVQHIDNLSTDLVDVVAENTLKPLLKRLKDKSEKCRELAAKILRALIMNVSELSFMLPYVFPTLVARLGSEDLDGVAHLPEAMRPNPEQKPVELSRPVEESEEVRLELARFVAALLSRCTQHQVYAWIDEATGLIRAQAMDPFHEVKLLSCETMIAFCHNHTEMLLHFAEPLGRSLTSCLTHNHAKIRIAGLRALTAVLWCGVWKHNHEVLQVLMAWQDPNKVPIQAFYETVTNVNYMSTLTFDRHPAVRRFWYETLAHWLLRIPDKVDHEPYIFPYLLTGLCDENEAIALEVFWLIEKCGELYEQEHAEELKKTKQYGFDYGWTYSGRAFLPFPLRAIWGGGGAVEGAVRRTAAHGPDMLGDLPLQEHKQRDNLLGDSAEENALGEEVPLPQRDYVWPELQDLAVYRKLPRPRLGSRCYVRTHTRRYIKATFNDVVDFRDCTALNAGRLLCMSIAYTEEGVTEWLQPMFQALTKFFSGRAWAAGDTEVVRCYNTVCKLLGGFLDPASYWAQLKGALDEGSVLDLDQRIASVRILSLCLEGSVEALKSVQPPDPNLGLGRLAPVIPELIDAMHASDLVLAPPQGSRETLWGLLFSFLEPLRPLLAAEHTGQLLFVALALAGQAPPEAASELQGAANVETEEGLVDADKLERALAALNTGLQQPSKGSMLDSLDGDDEEEEQEAKPDVSEELDPRVKYRLLFQRAFAEVLQRLDDAFQVFRSVVYLTPLSVLTSEAHADAVLRRLELFLAPTRSPPTRCAAQSLAVHLALRCSHLVHEKGAALATQARSFIRRVFHLTGEAQAKSLNGPPAKLSYASVLTGMSTYRRYVLCPWADPLGLLSSPASGSSKCLAWLSNIFADQELYKRYHMALEQAETTLTGQDKENFVVAKARQLREESERQSHQSRAMAASLTLLGLRRSLQTSEGSHVLGEAKALFLKTLSLFRQAEPTLEPPFVRPTPPALFIYAANLLHLLLHLPNGDSEALPPAFTLLDDPANVIHKLPAPPGAPHLPPGLELRPEESEALVSDFVAALLNLNLTLPPDPKAKSTPASLDTAPGEIVLGWDSLLDSKSSSAFASGPCVSEVPRLLVQSQECLRWNAALALYILGLDLTVVCPVGFQRAMTKWQKRQEQAKALIAADLLARAKRVLEPLGIKP